MKINVSLLSFLPKPRDISITLEGGEATIEDVMGKIMEEMEEAVRERFSRALEHEGIPLCMIIANGITIPRERWREHHVKDGDSIVILPLLVGGG
jgi:sulfur carrier protein ThiS